MAAAPTHIVSGQSSGRAPVAFPIAGLPVDAPCVVHGCGCCVLSKSCFVTLLLRGAEMRKEESEKARAGSHGKRKVIVVGIFDFPFHRVNRSCLDFDTNGKCTIL